MPDRPTVEANKKALPPGSLEARNNGCTCNPEANHFGKGYMGREACFQINSECPLHWWDAPKLKTKR